MIKFIHKTDKKKEVFVSCSENIEEEKHLNTLASETKMICDMCKKTGLWIVSEFQFNSRKVLVTSLDVKIEVCSKELSAIEAELTKRLQIVKN